MAKNTLSSEFRNIDVDQYNEDNYKDDDDTQTHVTVDESTVLSLINKGNHADAFRMLLQTAPMTAKDENDRAKSAHFALVLKVLLSVPKSQMDSIISQLDTTQLDILMKYVYKGFEIPSENSSAILLHWHDRIYNVAGLGCIVRVLTDRRRV